MARVAMPVAADFEDSELTVPKSKLESAGHQVVLIGSKRGETVEGKRGQAIARIDAGAAEVEPEQFDALVIPGGHSPDKLRLDSDVVGFVRRFCDTGRPVAAVCHGPQLLIEADVVRGRTLTSWPSVRTDLVNAGAEWIDRPVVIDGNFITSRKPEDLEDFSKAVLERL